MEQAAIYQLPRRIYTHEGLQFHQGTALPFGATVVPGGVNFSVASNHATACVLVLYEKGAVLPLVEIPMPPEFRVGSVFAITVLNLDYANIEYGYRMYGPWNPEGGHRFDPDVVLLDPYAKAVSGRAAWAEQADTRHLPPYRGRIPTPDTFDWGTDRPLETPIEDIVIYEMHVRGFTRHSSSGVQNPGTYLGVIEKIPYLKELGVNAVELLPVFEFDEFENHHRNPETGELLLNYWGYSTTSFFAPKAGYAAWGAQGEEINEFKWMVKALHENGIEVILDVVFNHTTEGNEKGPTVSFRGIDNQTYYILTPDGYYYNFSGTGNTFNCNHPVVSEFIVDCLRYWVTDYHIDGFRFDLASILTRDLNGMPMSDPPLLKKIAFDPVLRKTKLIAEPWDADGLYHVGSFPAYGRWAEWNGRYRDTMRKFLKGDSGELAEVAQVIQGSPHLYTGRGPIASVNFITAHDGFTLMDLVSYDGKHNDANHEGENAANDNHSWNHGYEGATDDPEISALRRRQIKNAIALLMVSQGVPMFLMGDEVGRTQHGNNNTYCQDNDLSWLDWRLLEQNADLFRFFKYCVAFRRAHPTLRNGHFLWCEDYQNVGCPDFTLLGVKAEKPSFAKENRRLAFMLCGDYAKGGLFKDTDIYVAMNMQWSDKVFELPVPREGRAWHVFANTGDETAEIYPPWQEAYLPDQEHLSMKSRSVAILVGK
jgi:isoamylase